MNGYESQGSATGGLIDRAPHAQDAEAGVLGAMLMATDAIDAAMELLGAECFYIQQHRALFGAICELREKSVAVDPATLSDQLRRDGRLEEIGGLRFVYDIAGSVPTAAHVEDHAKIVREKYRLRLLQELCYEGLRKTSSPVESVGEVLDGFESRLLTIGEDRRRKSPRAGEHIHALMEDLERRSLTGGGIEGVKTGFVDLDKMLGGLQGADLCIVAGYTSHGKTAFALQVALNAVRILPGDQERVPTAMFSLEMPEKQLLQRLISNLSGVDMNAFRTARFSEEQWRAITNAADELYGLPLFIEHVPGASLLEIRAKARRLKRTGKIGLVIVDYLQLASAKGESRQQEVAAVARGLKYLAGEIDVPVMALSQLNREAIKRLDPTPRLSDLRESGEIEQAADQVLFVYRPGQEKQMQTDSMGEVAPIPKAETELLLEKNRNGPTGRTYANFDGATQSFTTRSNR